MPRRCSVCQHPQRAAIDAELARNRAFAALSREYGLSPDALRRHSTHIARNALRAQEAAEVAVAGDLRGKVADLEVDARRIQRQAEGSGDSRCALMAVRERARIAELEGRLTGELTPAAAVVGVSVERIQIIYPDDEGTRP